MQSGSRLIGETTRLYLPMIACSNASRSVFLLIDKIIYDRNYFRHWVPVKVLNKAVHLALTVPTASHLHPSTFLPPFLSPLALTRLRNVFQSMKVLCSNVFKHALCCSRTVSAVDYGDVWGVWGRGGRVELILKIMCWISPVTTTDRRIKVSTTGRLCHMLRSSPFKGLGSQQTPTIHDRSSFIAL